MDSAYDVSDPSDWLSTPVSKLAPVETALRCQVCKDFFTTPLITSCSHTFCSLCIRRCLTTDGKCPTCRAVDQEVRLRPNWIVQELVDAFQAARPEILQLGEDVVLFNEAGKRGYKKRNIEAMEDNDEETFSGPNTRRKMTRSQHRVATSEAAAADDDVQIVDGLIPCPICNLRMKEEEVFTHLDVHTESDATNGGAMIDRSIKGPQTFLEKGSKSRSMPNNSMDRLPQLNYSLLNDNALRRKLTTLGLPNHGPRMLLQRRHTEWVNLVNSNCDSRSPKSKRELLHDLDVWERSQGRQIASSDSAGPSVMDKDFDGAGWVSKHDSSFKKLIVEAKKKAQSQKKVEDTAEAQVNDESDIESKAESGTALEK